LTDCMPVVALALSRLSIWAAVLWPTVMAPVWAVPPRLMVRAAVEAAVPILMAGAPAVDVPTSIVMLPAVPALALPVRILRTPVLVVPVPVLMVVPPEAPAPLLPVLTVKALPTAVVMSLVMVPVKTKPLVAVPAVLVRFSRLVVVPRAPLRSISIPLVWVSEVLVRLMVWPLPVVLDVTLRAALVPALVRLRAPAAPVLLLVKPSR
jgi:hypothetical protein